MRIYLTKALADYCKRLNVPRIPRFEHAQLLPFMLPLRRITVRHRHNELLEHGTKELKVTNLDRINLDFLAQLNDHKLLGTTRVQHVLQPVKQSEKQLA